MAIQRNYAKLKASPGYLRRVTTLVRAPPFLDKREVALIEHTGSYPKFRPSHGNSIKATSGYVRTAPGLSTAIRKRLDNNTKPRNLYNEMVGGIDEIEHLPRDFVLLVVHRSP